MGRGPNGATTGGPNGARHIMNGSKPTNRRTVLKTLSAGVVGGAVLADTAGAHGSEDWGTPAWLLTDVWEMADREPSGGEDVTGEESHVPIYYIGPDATGERCPQLTDVDFSKVDSYRDFESGQWDAVDVDQTLHDLDTDRRTEYTTLWHEHFVFDTGPSGASGGYTPADLAKTDSDDNPLIDSGAYITADKCLEVVSVPYVFNCPARPAQGDHRTYCE